MHNRFQFITLNTGILTVFTFTDDEQMSFGCIEWEKSDSAIWSPENTYFSLTIFFWLAGLVLNSGTAHLMTSLMG